MNLTGEVGIGGADPEARRYERLARLGSTVEGGA